MITELGKEKRARIFKKHTFQTGGLDLLTPGLETLEA